MKCIVKDCNTNKIFCRKMCSKHYVRWQRYKDVNATKLIKGNHSKRFWIKVDKTKDCWNWIGSTWGKGYGKYTVNDKSIAAHRFAYQDIKGDIPKGLQLDHLCMNKLCVNPDHLEPVTNSENQYRAFKKRGAWPIQTRKSKKVICQVCNKHFESIMYERSKYCSNACRCKAQRTRNTLD